MNLKILDQNRASCRRVVTENMKINAMDAISKFYFEKVLENVKNNNRSQKGHCFDNSVTLTFYVNMGTKVKINQINFVDNTVNEQKLKKAVERHKEMTRLTLHPTADTGGFRELTIILLATIFSDKGYLTFSKTKRVLDPYIRMNLFIGQIQ